MSDESVLYETHDRVALISHNRPAQMNASSKDLRLALRRAMNKAENDETIRVVVLTGEGRAFHAGADLKDEHSPDHRTISEHILLDHKPLIDNIRRSRKTYIAAINGAAAGIGMSYALACDLMMMAENAYLYSPFASIGLVPDGGACHFLLSRLGRHRAYQFIVESERLSAPECYDLGVANKVVPTDGFREAALGWARDLSTQRAPLPLRYVKSVLNSLENESYNKAVHMEAEIQHTCYNSRDKKEGVDAFFEKRKPVFVGQ
ncbi:MAG: enoyl-CoA hydratase/isomerase family protein [Pseudomonadota bacterium]